MTQLNVKRPFWKQALLTLAKLPAINQTLIAVAKSTPPAPWKLRIPLKDRKVRVQHSALNQDIVLTQPNRCQVAREIFWYQGNLAGEADQLSLDTAIRLSKDASLFLDIGAYTGLFALAAARAEPRLISHAYEIIEENYLVLESNIAANGLGDRVQAHLTGISNAAGSMRTPRGFGIDLLASSARLDVTDEGGLEVPLAPLDGMHKDTAGPVVMKIDVEGFEGAVFAGGSELIARTRPDIICEFLTRATDIADIAEQLRAHNYRFLHITDAGLREHSTISPDKHLRDWLLTTKTDAELSALGLPLSSG